MVEFKLYSRISLTKSSFLHKLYCIFIYRIKALNGKSRKYPKTKERGGHRLKAALVLDFESASGS